ncbi:MAG: hypothetical protein L6Q99_03595 [Planctomycetes bacterium]|nr:hypothetical protein [Planctomycetota bacterium]
MKRHGVWFGSALVCCVTASSALGQTTTCVHVDSAGLPADGWPGRANLSRDGRYVAFQSLADDLVPNDPGHEDVFVHDRATGATMLVSSASDGSSGNGSSLDPAFSADAGLVVFYSFASNFVAGDVNGTCDVFLKDRHSGVTTLVSRAFDGGSANSGSSAPVISGDGRWVAFESSATNLVASPAVFVQQVYRRDLRDGVNRLVSVSLTGGGAWDACYDSSISDDGRYVAFASSAENLVPGDTNSSFDVFVWDGATGSIERASVWTSGAEGAESYAPVLTADGRSVAFTCLTSLHPLDVNNRWDVYVRSLDASTTVPISRATDGSIGDGASVMPSISADGRFVAFRSAATNFFVGNDDRTFDVYVRDRLLATTELVSVSSTGALPNDHSAGWVSVSADGRAVAYDSSATNLVAGDVNGWPDIFVSDASVVAPVAGYGTAKTNSQACVPVIGSAGAPRASGADAFFVTAVRVLNQKSGICFWGRASASLPFGGGTLWVAPPLVRSGVLLSGGSSGGTDCTGAYSFHFSQGYMAAKLVQPGDTLYAQFWSRDPGFAPPDNVGLTDALVFTVAN